MGRELVLQRVMSKINTNDIKCGCDHCLICSNHWFANEEFGDQSSIEYKTRVAEIYGLKIVPCDECLLIQFFNSQCKKFNVPLIPVNRTYVGPFLNENMWSDWGQTIKNTPYAKLINTLYQMTHHLNLICPAMLSPVEKDFNKWFTFDNLSLFP